MTEKEFEVFEETMIPIIDAIEAKKNVICSAVKTHFEAEKEETNEKHANQLRCLDNV